MNSAGIKDLLDMNELGPDYQMEKSIEFNARVEWYMDTYYNPLQRSELYMEAYREAVNYANKAIMLSKLEIDPADDLEMVEPDLFKSTLAELVVDMPLIKSDNGSLSVNEMYENLWRRTFDTVKTKVACRT
jgi:hypothetical protein